MSEKINDGGFAFPSHEAGPTDPRNHISGGGMTLRDYFAAKALNSVCLSYVESAEKVGYDENWMDGVARDAYAIADAMLKARQS